MLFSIRQGCVTCIINYILIITFLWSNLAWAGGVECFKLSPSSQVVALVPITDTFAIGQDTVKRLTRDGVRTKEAFYRKIREELKNGRIEYLAGFPCLVFSDKEDNSRLSYYVFNPKEPYFSRITTHPTVNDPFWQVFNRAGAGISSEKLEFSIDGKRYYQEIYTITNNESGFINACLKELYPRHDDKLADMLRKKTLEMIYNAGSGHIGASFSCAEIISVLYSSVMRYDPKNPGWEDRDRFIISKGHAAPVLYAVLGLAGFFPEEEFGRLRKIGSLLQGHPKMEIPGVDSTTGRLGQGPSFGAGLALSAKKRGKDYRTYVLIGDAEFNEGQIKEAAEHIPVLGLDNLTVILDNNRHAKDRPIGEISRVDHVKFWESCGWNVISVDGHNVSQLLDAFNEAKRVKGKPTIIIAHTKKGKGAISIEADPVRYHGKVPTREVYEEAIREIEKRLGDFTDEDARRLLRKGISGTNSVGYPVFIPPARTNYKEGTAVATGGAFGDYILKIAEKNGAVYAGSADLTETVSLLRFSKDYPGRYIPFGIHEAHMASVAGGLASTGIIPFIGTMDVFTEEMSSVITIIDQMRLPVVFEHTHSGIAVGEDGTSHQSRTEPLKMLDLPNIHYFEPADANETEECLDIIMELASKGKGPFYLRLTRQKVPAINMPFGMHTRDGAYCVYDSRPLTLTLSDPRPAWVPGVPMPKHGSWRGKGERENSSYIFIAAGAMVSECIKSAEVLKEIGIYGKVINMPRPDYVEKNPGVLISLLEKGVPIFTVHDATPRVLGSVVNGIVTGNKEIQPITVKNIGIPGWTESGSTEELYNKYGLSSDRLVINVLSEHNSAMELPDIAQELLLILEDGKDLVNIREKDIKLWPIVQSLKALVMLYKEIVPRIYGLKIKDKEKEELIGTLVGTQDRVGLHNMGVLSNLLMIASGEGFGYESLRNLIAGTFRKEILGEAEALYMVSPDGIETDLMKRAERGEKARLYEVVNEYIKKVKEEGIVRTDTGKSIFSNLVNYWQRNIVILGKDIEAKWVITFSDENMDVYIKAEFYYRGTKIGEGSMVIDTTTANIGTPHFMSFKDGHGLDAEMEGKMYLVACIIGEMLGLNVQSTPGNVVSEINRNWQRIFYEDRIKAVYGGRAWEDVKGGIDFSKIELVKRGEVIDSALKGLRDYFDKHRKKKTLTQEVTQRIAGACAGLFINVYKNGGRVMMEPIDLIGEIISLEDEEIARSGTNALFGGIIEFLNDTFLFENRRVSMQVLARVTWRLANSSKGKLVKDTLAGFGINSEDDLLNRAYKTIEERRFNGDPAKVKKAIVFSRITKGADVAVNSIIMERLKSIFPNTEIVLLGIPKDKELFGGDSRIRIEEIDYERRGPFISRLNNWADVVNKIKGETQGLDKDEYVVIDADTRVSQVGVLPCTEELDNYFFLLSTLGIEGNTLGEVVNNWMGRVFSGSSFTYPTVSLKEENKAFASQVRERLKDRYLISVSLGVGGVERKKLGRGFDLELIERLLELTDNTTILLDKDTDEYNEPSYVTELVGELRRRGKVVVDTAGLTEGIAPDIVTWHGSLGGFSGLIGISDQYVGYDSCFGHVAGALGIPETIIFAGHPNNIFLRRWTPLNQNELRIVEVKEDKRKDEDRIMDEVVRECIGYLVKKVGAIKAGELLGVSEYIEGKIPILCHPNLVRTAWGGHRIEGFKGIGKVETDENQDIGESWELSSHRDHPSYITTKTGLRIDLITLFKYWGDWILCEGMDSKPTFVKLLNSSNEEGGNLSVQAHPDDEYARTHENDSGKVESWYILDAEPDSVIYLGFKDDVNLDEFRRDLARDDVNIAEKYMNIIPVGRILQERREGGKGHEPLVLYIPYGTAHAIGKGIFLVEIQQTSGVTYRVWDWNRKPPRPLHIDKALDIMNLKKTGIEDYLVNGANLDSPYFSYRVVDIKPNEGYRGGTKGIYRDILCINGRVRINDKDGKKVATLKSGESALIPATMDRYSIGIIGKRDARVVISWYKPLGLPGNLHDQIVYRAGILRKIGLTEPGDFANVLLGLKKIDIVEKGGCSLFLLRVFKYVTGYSIKLFKLGDGRYCIYDENYLRYMIQKAVAEGELGEDVLYLCATQAGLEQEIMRQLATESGVFYEIAEEKVDKEIEDIARLLSRYDYGIKPKKRIDIDALFIPTYKRPTALRRALELQTNNMRMFGHTHIPILVCSNVNPDETARFMSDEDVNEFKRFYNVDNPRGMKWGELDRIVIEDFRQKGFNVRYIDWNVRNRIIDDVAPVIAAKYKKSEDEIRKILEIILASNVSGIRNFTILLGNGTRMISVDDDALPKMRAPKRDVLERILEERGKKARELEERFYRELSEIRGEPDKVKELIKKYYSYSEDGQTGLIPQALGQIVKEKDTEDYWRFNHILRDEDNIYCGSLPPYLVATEDVMIQDVDRTEYQFDEWDIDYMRILSETLGSPAINPSVGWVFRHDKRGVAGSIAGEAILKALLERTIGIATTHFNHDQDWSGEALLDSFIERGAKVTDLQRATRKAIHLEVGGFSNPDAQFCFNTTSIDNTMYPVPTIGEMYRTEEPYYTYSVRAVTGRFIAWSRTVGGHHRLDVSTRPNVPHQILNEETAMVAWRLYDKAVKDTEQHFGNDYSNPGERMRYLGERFVEYGRDYELDDWAIERMTRLQERIVKKIGDIIKRAQGEGEDVKKGLYAVVGELMIEFVIPQSNATVVDKNTIIYTRDGWPIKIIEKRIGEQRERMVEIVGDFDDAILRLDEDVRREFLNKVTGMIKTQVVNDGLTFLFWPDLVDAESNEINGLAKALSVLLGKEIMPQWLDVYNALYGEFSERIEDFTGIRFTDIDRLIKEDLRINRDEAEGLIYGYLRQIALGLAELNKPIKQITLDEFNKLFGVRHIVLAGGLGQRYSASGLWHKALGIVGDSETNIRLAVSGAYSSKGIRPIIIITTRILQAVLRDGVRIDSLNPGIVDERYINNELLPENAILVWRKPEEGGGYGMDFMRGVLAADGLGILEDTAYVEIVFGEMATNQDKGLSNTSLATYLKAVSEGYFITVAGRKDKVVKDKGTFTYDEEGRLLALTDWKRLTDDEKTKVLNVLEREGVVYINANCGIFRREIIQYFDRFIEDPRFKGQRDPRTGQLEYIPWDLVRFIRGEHPVGIMRLENAPPSIKDIAGQNRLNVQGLTLNMDQAYRRGRVDIRSPDVRIGNGTYLRDVELSGKTHIGDGWAVIDSVIEDSHLADHDLTGYRPPFKGRTNAKNTIEGAVIRNTVIPEERLIPKGARIEGIMPEEMRLAWELLGGKSPQIEGTSLRVALLVLEEMGYVLDLGVHQLADANVIKSGFSTEFYPLNIYERLFNALDNTIEVKFIFSLGSSKRVFKIKLPKEAKGRQKEVLSHYLCTYLYNLTGSRGADSIGVYTEDEEFTKRLLNILSHKFPLIEKNGKPGYSHIRPLLEKVYGKKVRFYKSSQDEIEDIEQPNVNVKTETNLPLLQALKMPKGVIAGIDAGGTDIKVVIYKDGRLVYAKEHIWEPKQFTGAEQHISTVEGLIRTGLSESGLDTAHLSAIGISWPDIVIGDRMIPLSSKVRGLNGEELEKISRLKNEISKRFGNIPVAIANDGNIGAFWAGVNLGKGNLIGISMGTSCGVGYIDREGRLTDFLTDMGSTVLNMTKAPNTAHNYSGIPGVAQKHLSQDGVFRLAQEFGLEIPEFSNNAEKLKYIQSLLNSQEPKAEEIFREIGRYLASFIEQIYLYFDESGTRNIVLFGRVINGRGGEIIISTARQLLKERVNIYLAPEITDNPSADRFGQAEGAVYLAYKRLLEEKVYSLIHELNKKGITAKINNKLLSEIESPELLLKHITDYTPIKDPEDIIKIIEDRLEGKDLFLYNAIFNQEEFLRELERPINIVMFRGGRGAGELTSLIKGMPNINVSAVLSGTDDGRSWYYAGQDFNATGVPDCGKTLLDLAEDMDLAKLLRTRLKGTEGEIERLITEFKKEDIIKYIKKFMDKLKKDYSWSSFSLHNMPVRSVVLLGAAWYYNGDWQRATDEIARLLDIKPENRVVFSTLERLHLVGLTKDGVIYFTETGINEHPRKEDFIGLWLFERKPDIDGFRKLLEERGINLDDVEVPEGISDELRKEVMETSRVIRERDRVIEVAQILSSLSLTEGGAAVANPAAMQIIQDADIIVYGPSSLESNIGGGLLPEGIQKTIRRNQDVIRVFFVNPTVENEPQDITAYDVLEKLYRYMTGQQGYKGEELLWEGGYIDYVLGRGLRYMPRDPEKVYIPFNVDNISRNTKGTVSPIGLNLEWERPVLKERRDYSGYEREYGFYSPQVMFENMVALWALHRKGFKVINGMMQKEREMSLKDFVENNVSFESEHVRMRYDRYSNAINIQVFQDIKDLYTDSLDNTLFIYIDLTEDYRIKNIRLLGFQHPLSLLAVSIFLEKVGFDKKFPMIFEAIRRKFNLPRGIEGLADYAGKDTAIYSDIAELTHRTLPEGITRDLGHSFRMIDFSGISLRDILEGINFKDAILFQSGDITMQYNKDSNMVLIKVEEEGKDRFEIYISLAEDCTVKDIYLSYSLYSLSRSTVSLIFNKTDFASRFPLIFDLIRKQFVFPIPTDEIALQEIIASGLIDIDRYEEMIGKGRVDEGLILELSLLRYSKSWEVRRKALKIIRYIEGKKYISPEGLKRYEGLFLREDIKEDTKQIERLLRNNMDYVRKTFKNLFGKDITLSEIYNSEVNIGYVGRGFNKQIYKIKWRLGSGEVYIFAISTIRDAQIGQGDFSAPGINSMLKNWERLSQADNPYVPRLGAAVWEKDYRPKKVELAEYPEKIVQDNIMFVSREFIEGINLEQVLSDTNIPEEERDKARLVGLKSLLGIWRFSRDKDGKGIFMTTPKPDDVVVFKGPDGKWQAKVIDLDALEDGITADRVIDIFNLYTWCPPGLVKRSMYWDDISGPKVVSIGGGNGPRRLAIGMAGYTKNMTNVITVFDNWGSTGVFRDCLDIPAVGDIRNRICALLHRVEAGAVLEGIFDHRLPSDKEQDELINEFKGILSKKEEEAGVVMPKNIREELERIISWYIDNYSDKAPLIGMSVGNIIIVSEYFRCGRDLTKAVTNILRLLGLHLIMDALPVTEANLDIAARLNNGQIIYGEHQIAHRENSEARIWYVFFTERGKRDEVIAPEANPVVLNRIEEADAIVIGPGSLHTSCVPNLKVKGIRESIRKSKGAKILIINLLEYNEREGIWETKWYKASQIVDEVLRVLKEYGFCYKDYITHVLVNNHGEKKGYIPVDLEGLKGVLMGTEIEVVVRDLEDMDFPGYHDPEKLSQAITDIVEKYRNPGPQDLLTRLREVHSETAPLGVTEGSVGYLYDRALEIYLGILNSCADPDILLKAWRVITTYQKFIIHHVAYDDIKRQELRGPEVIKLQQAMLDKVRAIRDFTPNEVAVEIDNNINYCGRYDKDKLVLFNINMLPTGGVKFQAAPVKLITYSMITEPEGPHAAPGYTDVKEVDAELPVCGHIRGTISGYSNEDEGFVRLDPPIGDLSAQDEDILLDEIIEVVKFLSKAINPNKKLILYDSVKNMFRKRGIDISAEVTLGGFIEFISGKKEFSKRVISPGEPPGNNVVIKNPLGLHARVAVKIVKFISRYSGIEVYIRKGAKKADAGSLSELIELAAEAGDFVEILVSSGSEDEREEIVNGIKRILEGEHELIGAKALGLTELKGLVTVPEAVFVTHDMYDLFIEQCDILPLIKEIEQLYAQFGQTKDTEILANIKGKAQIIWDRIMSSETPFSLQEMIKARYRELCGIAGAENLSVAVRSSSTLEDLLGASFAGIYETFLYVTGEDNVVDSVKNVWASLFSERAVVYSANLILGGISVPAFSKIKQGVIIQRMIDSVTSGVIYSADNSSGESAFYIEASYGVGKHIVDGKVTPDAWLIKKKDGGYEIIERYRCPERDRLCLTDNQVLELAENMDRIRAYYKERYEYIHMDVEFAFDKNGKAYFLQARPVDPVNLSLQRMEGSKEAFIYGIAGCPGTAEARIIHPKTIEDLPKEGGSSYILLFDYADSNALKILFEALDRRGVVGVITLTGGKTSHFAAVVREIGIPYVSGVGEIDLEDGGLIRINGTDGYIEVFSIERLYEFVKKLAEMLFFDLDEFFTKEGVDSLREKVQYLLKQQSEAGFIMQMEDSGVEYFDYTIGDKLIPIRVQFNPKRLHRFKDARVIFAEQFGLEKLLSEAGDRAEAIFKKLGISDEGLVRMVTEIKLISSKMREIIVAKEKRRGGEKYCNLCQEWQIQLEKGFSFRNFIVYPNPFPYVDGLITIAHKGHILQRLTDLEDMLWFARVAGYKVIFNSQNAGPSITEHRHYQAFPSSKVLPAEEIGRVILAERDGVSIYELDKDYPVRMLIIEGKNRRKVSRDVRMVTDYLGKAGLGYNLLMKEVNGLYQVYIVPRDIEEPSQYFGKFAIMEMFGELISPYLKENVFKEINEEDFEKEVITSLKNAGISGQDYEKLISFIVEDRKIICDAFLKGARDYVGRLDPYSPLGGIPALRELAARFINSKVLHSRILPQDVIVGPGTTGLLELFTRIFCDIDNAAIRPDEEKDLVALSPTAFSLYKDSVFARKSRFESLDSETMPMARIIVIDSTDMEGMKEDVLNRLLYQAHQQKSVVIFLDNDKQHKGIGLVYDLLSKNKIYRENVIIITDISRYFGLAHYNIGSFITFNRAIQDAFTTAAGGSYAAASQSAQAGFINLLKLYMKDYKETAEHTHQQADALRKPSSNLLECIGLPMQHAILQEAGLEKIESVSDISVVNNVFKDISPDPTLAVNPFSELERYGIPELFQDGDRFHIKTLIAILGQGYDVEMINRIQGKAAINEFQTAFDKVKSLGLLNALEESYAEYTVQLLKKKRELSLMTEPCPGVVSVLKGALEQGSIIPEEIIRFMVVFHIKKMHVGAPGFPRDSFGISAAMPEGIVREDEFSGLIDALDEVGAYFANDAYGLQFDKRNVASGYYGSKPVLQDALLGLSLLTGKPIALAIPKPYYVGYDSLRRSVGIPDENVIYVDTQTRNKWRPTRSEIMDSFKRYFKDKEEKDYQKVLLLTTPNNPTGVVLSKFFIKEVFRYAIQKNVFLVFDVAYARLLFNGRKPANLGQIIEEMAKELGKSREEIVRHFILVMTQSKEILQPGGRYGMGMSGNIELIEKMREIRTLRAEPIASYAEIKAYRREAERYAKRYIKRHNRHLQRNKEYICKVFDKLGIHYIEPEGAFYIMFRIGKSGYIRFSYAGSYGDIIQVMTRLQDYWGQIKGMDISAEELFKIIGVTSLDGKVFGATEEYEEYKGSHIVKSIEPGKKEEPVYSIVLEDMLRDALDRLKHIYGLGIDTMVDRIEIVENLGGDGVYPEGRAPLASYKNGVLKVDKLLFDYEPYMLFEELEHEFLESIAGIIPGSNHAISDVVSTVRNVRRFLGLTLDEQEAFLSVLRDKNPIDPDGEYLVLLERLRGVKEDKIIAGVIGYVMRTKLYEHVRGQLGLPKDIAQKIMALEPRLDDALAVFNEIAKAKELVEQIRETEEVAITVVKTFTGLRVGGLDKISRDLAGLVSAVAKQISSVDKLSGRLAKADTIKYILVDEGRLRELKDAMGEEKYKQIERHLLENNYRIVTELPAEGDVIRLVDPADVEGMPKIDGILYLPLPYTRSSFYMAALVLQAEGDLSKVPLVRRLIKELYAELNESDLGLLITQPWQILPKIQKVLDNLDNLRKAVVLIEEAA